MKRRARDVVLPGNSKKSKTADELEVSDSDEDQSGARESTSKAGRFKTEALWSIPEVLANSYNVPIRACKNLTHLLVEEECTLPFVARYRREAVGNLEIEDLRKMKSSIENLRKVQAKISAIIQTLKKQKVLTPSLSETICSAMDLDELEYCYAPYRDTKKRTLASRAKELGLEEAALKILNSSGEVSLHQLVDSKTEGLENLSSVELGIKHIVADAIGKDKENVDTMDALVNRSNVQLQVSKSRNASKADPNDFRKFEPYFASSFPVKSIKPHQFLTLSRGEDLKVLSIKISYPSQIEKNWTNHCFNKYLSRETNGLRKKIIVDSVNDAYSRIVEPLFSRRIRAHLTEVAHRASIDVFARNLKSLLLSPPLTNTRVLGMDPGFKHGCKCAVVAADGIVLHTDTLMIQFAKQIDHRQPAAMTLRRMVEEFGCRTIALGNGKACRETELFLSQLIQRNILKDVQFTIVNESGASVYSCSEEARAEFPQLDPNVISAISLARRLQDPLSEYVRVSPEHIGVGMYQHDIPVKKLETALDDIVSECVSFVGVDINTCPLHVLSKVAGLSVSKAKKIIDHRAKNGPFVNRNQILEVATIGQKTFEQCAGFLKVTTVDATSQTTAKPEKKAMKATARTKNTLGHRPDPLDRTGVHPESYDLARRIVHMFTNELDLIGHQPFIDKLELFRRSITIQDLATELSETVGTVEQIINSLTQPLQYDLREKFEKPMFKKGVMSMTDLKIGQQLTGNLLAGQISNVTDFGAFVDIGVGKDALLHVSGMKGKPKDSFLVGHRVYVRIKHLDVHQQRINLEYDELKSVTP